MTAHISQQPIGGITARVMSSLLAGSSVKVSSLPRKARTVRPPGHEMALDLFAESLRSTTQAPPRQGGDAGQRLLGGGIGREQANGMVSPSFSGTGD